MFRAVLRTVFEKAGYSLLIAEDGERAFEIFQERPDEVALLVSDVQMPGMTGIEVLQQLRGAEGPNRYVPVVALTADVTSGGRRRYLDIGFTEHSSKPIQIPDLMESVTRAMAAPAARRQSVQAA